MTLMNLSWDGGDTGYASRGAAPICMQVMNVNSTMTGSVGLVEYVPHLEVSDACRETEKYKTTYFYLLHSTGEDFLERADVLDFLKPHLMITAHI